MLGFDKPIGPLKVAYDKRARDGTWCTLPYPGHPRGCPNYPDCVNSRPDFKTFSGYEWYAVVEPFDLKAHADKMHRKHPHWTERQCKNVLYWQGAVRKRLKEKARKFLNPLMGDVLLDIPEASGVNLFKTMAQVGLYLKANPDFVYKIMLIGKNPHCWAK